MTKYNYTVRIILRQPIEIEADTEKEAIEKFDEDVFSDLLIKDGSCGSIERELEGREGDGVTLLPTDMGYGLHYMCIIQLEDEEGIVVSNELSEDRYPNWQYNNYKKETSGDKCYQEWLEEQIQIMLSGDERYQKWREEFRKSLRK